MTNPDLDNIAAAIAKGPTTINEVIALGYSRFTAQRLVKILVDSQRIYRHGGGKKSYYTVHQEEAATLPPAKITLPDLPDLALRWLGYTDLVPDKKHAYRVWGE